MKEIRRAERYFCNKNIASRGREKFPTGNLFVTESLTLRFHPLATATPTTFFAPACLRTFLASRIVAPVVKTSSTRIFYFKPADDIRQSFFLVFYLHLRFCVKFFKQNIRADIIGQFFGDQFRLVVSPMSQFLF